MSPAKPKRRDQGEERDSKTGSPERGDAVAVPADRRLRLPLQLPHRRPGGAGRRDRLALRPSVRLAQRLRHPARPAGGLVPVRPVRDQRADRRIYEPGTNILNTTWHTPTGWAMVREALTLGPHPATTRSPRTPAPPPTRTPSPAGSGGALPRGLGRDGDALRAGLRLRTRAREWSLRRRPPHRRRHDPGCVAPAAEQHAPRDRGQDRRSARHTLQEGEQAFCSLSWAEELASPEDIDEANARMGETTRLLARLALRGPDARPPFPRGDPALGARDQGTHLHADRSHGGSADDLPSGDPGRRAQLGLPLHLDPRLDLHPAGAPLPQPRLGSQRVHAVHGRPRGERGRGAADHVRDRRAPRPDRVASG